MRVSHGVTAVFDDPNLVSCAGLVPVLELADRAGLPRLAAEHLTLTRLGGANPQVKVPALVAGMVAGADSIDIEQVIADLKNGPLAHLPSGRFWANSAWLVCRRHRVQPNPCGRRPRLHLPRTGKRPRPCARI